MANKGKKLGPRSEETRKRISEALKRRFADPAAREAQSERCKELWASGKLSGSSRVYSDEARARMSAGQRKRFADPAAREAQQRKQKELWQTPEYQKIREKKKAMWTPELRAAVRAAILAAKGRAGDLISPEGL